MQEKILANNIRAATAILNANGDCNDATGYAGGVVPCIDCPMSYREKTGTDRSLHCRVISQCYKHAQIFRDAVIHAKVEAALKAWCTNNAPEVLINLYL